MRLVGLVGGEASNTCLTEGFWSHVSISCSAVLCLVVAYGGMSCSASACVAGRDVYHAAEVCRADTFLLGGCADPAEACLGSHGVRLYLHAAQRR